MIGLLACSPAAAEDWSFRVTPYAWGIGFASDAFLEDEETETSTDFIDYLDGAFLINAEARRGRLSLIGEYNWLDLSDDIDTPGSFFQLESRLQGYMFALGAGWAVHETETSRFELMGGARHWDLEYSVDLGPLPNISVSKVFTDPFIGVRGDYSVTDRILLTGEAGVGGFGVGSDMQVDLHVRGAYAFTDLLSGVVGYRYLDVDLGEDDPLQSMTFWGPYVALDFRF